ncbi:U11/U12 small nuclear ribonucleoprotein 25 kDa protein [Spea bombifrons]|uniref:U11/U12 small nuclear ribonucleoprotein 25 kDa protein n=1 Tax=Spea bombifrons TaxID=233779 RepID=UPI002349304D|nr:U11/U12 small nuclear ribonucleoprotein 25 kDa protein [Spea bombifrons]
MNGFVLHYGYFFPLNKAPLWYIIFLHLKSFLVPHLYACREFMEDCCNMADNIDILMESEQDNDTTSCNPAHKLKQEDLEEVPHAEVVDIFQEGLAMLVQDPLLCDLPIQVTLEEVHSQIALEFGQAMTVRICKADGEMMPVVVVQTATVLDLKRAIQRYTQLKHQREGGVQHISWKYIWRTYNLSFSGLKLENDNKSLREYGIKNRDEVVFVKKLKNK